MIDYDQFRQQLRALTRTLPQQRFVIAYSGGLDSRVLLQLCHQCRLPVRAVYINHQLQAAAAAWAQHCAQTCQTLGIDFTQVMVQAHPAAGESPEDAARIARYSALHTALADDECLLTAHHAGDQAETVLLQLLRGGGAAGLSAMPVMRVFGRSWLLRPLLSYARSQLLAYARAHQLSWIDDPSNEDTRYDRNYLRQQVMPLLRARWPAVEQSLQQSASQQQDNLEILQALAEIDLASASSNGAHELVLSALQALTEPRLFNVLRCWIRLHTQTPPTRKLLYEIQQSVMAAQDDAAPVLRCGEYEIRRYRQALYLLPRQQPFDIHQVLLWDGHADVELHNGLRISVRTDCKAGLDERWRQHKLSLRFRQGGERLRVTGKPHHQSLKKLMQGAQIPPWQREQIPLLYVEDELACVCGYWTAHEFSVAAELHGWLPVLDRG